MKKRALLFLISVMTLVAGGVVSCQQSEVDEPQNTLTVTPSDNISFRSTANNDVVLTVTTDADTWNFTKPDWVTAVKSEDGNTLTVNATDNTTDGSRAGRLEITAGTADPVQINITQNSPADDPAPGTVAGMLRDASGQSDVAITYPGESVEPVVAELSFSIDISAEEDVVVQIVWDEAYLVEYNFINGAECELFPEELISIAGEGLVTLAPGTTNVTVPVTFTTDSDLLFYNVDYLIPLQASVVSDNVTVNTQNARVNYVLNKVTTKQVRNVLYFEVNDTNPLNALEYKLEDGQYFFDAIVIFAANINYNATADLVYTYNNPNVQALLDEHEIYLQPLRRAGIKVYLGILGNHDAAGVAQLSDWGAQQYAFSLANLIDQYQLDGVSFDDEYSESPDLTNRWFTTRSYAAASRLCYETKLAMREVTGADKDVMVFYFAYLSSSLPSVDGVAPGEFIDLTVADYGSAAAPLSGATLASCSGMSVQLNLGGGTTTEAYARQVKNAGYGWYMWFALNPDPASGTATVTAGNIAGGSTSRINNVCRGLYDQSLVTPTHYYKKIDQGVYDPVRYAY